MSLKPEDYERLRKMFNPPAGFAKNSAFVSAQTELDTQDERKPAKPKRRVDMDYVFAMIESAINAINDKRYEDAIDDLDDALDEGRR